MNEKLKITYVDCVWKKGKNFQKINTIEMFFAVNMEGEFFIEYNFHSIDFDYWKEIALIHVEDIDFELSDDFGDLISSIDAVKNDKEYFTLIISSNNPNLYRNINYIFFFKNSETGENNMDDMIDQNTWEESEL